jgi:hypothetical protein
MLNRLPLSVTDSHRKRDFGRVLSSAPFEENGKTYHINTDDDQQIRSNVSINVSFLPLLSKRQNLEIDSAVSSGDQRKYAKYVIPSLGLRVREHYFFFLTLAFFVKKTVIQKILIKQTRIPLVPIHNFSTTSIVRSFR